MKILFIGDIHGEFKALNYELKKLCHKEDYNLIIQTGDFGIWADSLEKSKKCFDELFHHIPFWFVRGNHEEYTRGGEPYFDDYDNIIAPKYFKYCLLQPRHFDGQSVYVEPGKEIFMMGGAVSHDKKCRTEGKNLWSKRELPNMEYIDKAIEDKINPDIIVTHACPSNAIHRVLGDSIRSGDLGLGKLYDNIQPKLWIFGHQHASYDAVDKVTGTHFIGLHMLGHKGWYKIIDTEKI